METVNSISRDKFQKNLIEQQETFIAALGHDLKNPTIAQIRALELCLKGTFGNVPQSQREILEMVLDSCKYMNAMLGSLLTTYKYEKGTIKLESEELSMHELTCECIEEMVYLAKDKGINIEYYNNAKTDKIYGDRVQIKRVVMNLLSNGIKYAFNNSILKVQIYNEDNYTGFMFENNSPYIPEDKQSKIFARYVTYAQAHQKFGIGLGLYSSKKIVEAHNGNIFVKSFTDNRNVFGFTIPNDESYRYTSRSVTF